MRILVTGGAGFIGSHLVEALLRAPQNEVVVLDTFLTGRPSNLADAEKEPRLHIVEGSVADGVAVRRALDGVALLLVEDHITGCMTATVGSSSAAVSDLLSVVRRYIRST